VDTGAVVHTLDLSSDADAVAAEFSKSARRNIRLAERRGVVVRRARDERELTEVFFGLHLATRHRLGVPVQPKRFFDRLWTELNRSNLGFVLVAEQEGRPVASAVFLQAAGTVVYKYSASDVASLSSKPNDLLIATAIRQACESGCVRFDFGRSDIVTEGLRAFKRGFGAEESALTYSVVGEPAAAGGRDESGIMQRVLQRSPAWATRLAGEMLYRYAA
jgi:lipid II:glycine glycyltransferase (peptidoglycan interpeptide bridge formation enzyme)